MIAYKDFNKGRLGNQLFFVAATIGTAIKNNVEYAFANQMGYGGINYQKMFENDLPITTSVPQIKYYQNGFAYEDINIKEAELVGFFQSEKFFIHCKNVIKKQFEFKKEIVEDVFNKYPNIKNSLSIHIRRGDYVEQQDHHPIIPIFYYEKILKEISNSYNNIFIFSDDIDWAKKNFIGEKYIFPKFDIDDSINSFVLMSLSQDNIIGNSTYSWWAAWLNKNKNKKIYSPHHLQWFGPSYSNLDTKDLIPNNWIEIKYI